MRMNGKDDGTERWEGIRRDGKEEEVNREERMRESAAIKRR